MTSKSNLYFPLVQELTSICSMLRYIIQYLKIHPGVQCSTRRPRPIFASVVLQIEPSFCLVEWAVVVLSSGQHEQEPHQVQHCQQGHHHHQGVLCVRHSPIQGDRRDLWHVLHHHHPYKVRSAPAVTKLNGQLGIAPISRNHSQAVGQKFLRSTQKFIFEEYTEFSFWGTHRNVALKYIFQWPPSILRTTRWKNSWQWFKNILLIFLNYTYWK